MDKEKITFIAYSDHANVLTNWNNAINKYSSKYESIVICLTKNIYFKHDIVVTLNMRKKKNIDKINYIKKWIFDSTHIISGFESTNIIKGTDLQLLCNKLKIDISILLNSKKISVFYAGSMYRKKYEKINMIINNYCNHKQIYAPDLYRLSLYTPNDIVLYPLPLFEFDRIDICNCIKNRFNDKLLILHSPSKTKAKGTNKIKIVINKLFQDEYINNRFTYINTRPRTAFDEIVELKKKATIYIDIYSIGNYSTFALASLESLALGNIVFSSLQNISNDTLEKMSIDIGTFPILNTGNTDDDFLCKLKKICYLSDNELEKEMMKSMDYYLNNMNKQKFCNEFEEKVLDNH